LSAPDGADEFRRGWSVALSALLGICFGLASIPFYTFGIFAPHLAAAFHWSIAEIMWGLAITGLMVAWAAPVAGLLATRLGSRRVALVSVVLLGGLIVSSASPTDR
jgi:predicted MFS family arabinose efflux permease